MVKIVDRVFFIETFVPGPQSRKMIADSKDEFVAHRLPRTNRWGGGRHVSPPHLLLLFEQAYAPRGSSLISHRAALCENSCNDSSRPMGHLPLTHEGNQPPASQRPTRSTCRAQIPWAHTAFGTLKTCSHRSYTPQSSRPPFLIDSSRRSKSDR